MNWPSRRLRWPVFWVAFFVYVLVLAAELGSADLQVAVPLDELPPSYGFLMFPVGQVSLHDSKALAATGTVGELQRAVGVSADELASGVVAVRRLSGDTHYAAVTDLRFLPASSGLAQISRWQEERCPASMTCKWETEDLANGNRLVQVRVIDHKHGRRSVYRYETDGERLVTVYDEVRRSIFDDVDGILLFLVAVTLTLVFCVAVFRGQEPRATAARIPDG